MSDKKYVVVSPQTRRLQLSGGSTYVVSLPKVWVEDMNLKVGGHITITKNANQSLTLFTASNDQSNKKTGATIHTSQKDSVRSINRKIIAAYLGGYVFIKIKSRGIRIQPEHARAIRMLVRTTMIGTEIVETSSEAIIIQVLTRLPELSFETALKRMYMMAINMHREAIESISDVDVKHSQSIIKMDDEVDRFSLYMRRNLAMSIDDIKVLQDMGLKNTSDCLGYRTIISRIERIADHAVMIAKRVKFVDGQIDLEILESIGTLSEQSLQVFQDAVVSLEKKDYHMAENVASKVSRIIDQEKDIMLRVNDTAQNSGVIRFILEDIRRVAEYSEDIAEVAIDQNIDLIVDRD